MHPDSKFELRGQTCAMSSIDDADRLCTEGYWIELGNAANIQDLEEEEGGEFINGKKVFKQRAQLNESIHVEHGRDTKVPVYNKFEFVYQCAPGTKASASLSLPLSRWCKLCAKLENESSWAELDSKLRVDFKQYTGLDATLENIRLALLKGVITTTGTLRGLLDEEQRKVKEKEETTKAPGRWS